MAKSAMAETVKKNAWKFMGQKDFWSALELSPRGWNSRKLSESGGETAGRVWLTLVDRSGYHVYAYTDNGLRPFSDAEAERQAERYKDHHADMERNLAVLAECPDLRKMWDACEEQWKCYSFDVKLSTNGDLAGMDWVSFDVEEIRLHKGSGRVTVRKRTDYSNPCVRHNMD